MQILASDTAPINVNLRRISFNEVLLRWSYPSQSRECGLYFVISGTMDDASIQLIVDGSLREYRIQNSATTITLEVAAASRLGVGPASAPVHLNSGRQGMPFFKLLPFFSPFSKFFNEFFFHLVTCLYSQIHRIFFS